MLIGFFNVLPAFLCHSLFTPFLRLPAVTACLTELAKEWQFSRKAGNQTLNSVRALCMITVYFKSLCTFCLDTFMKDSRKAGFRLKAQQG